MAQTAAAFREADLAVAVRSDLQGLVISDVFKLDFGGDGAYALFQASLVGAGLETDVHLSATLSPNEDLEQRQRVYSSSTGYGALTWLMLQQLRTRLRTNVLD